MLYCRLFTKLYQALIRHVLGTDDKPDAFFDNTGFYILVCKHYTVTNDDTKDSLVINVIIYHLNVKSIKKVHMMLLHDQKDFIVLIKIK